VVRNVWAYSIIFCGHFPSGVQSFSEDETAEETRGEWYVRQLLGSANISGSPLFHIMSGNLSHQIEHHLFPDLPAHRYPELAPRVRELCEQYGLPYNSRGLTAQVASVWKKIFTFALPPNWVSQTPDISVLLERSPREQADDAAGTLARENV
jgi:linoleoyl-CoA desaturase